MVDSTNIADEPSADLVAYYIDGRYATSEAAVRARFPNAIPVAISAIGTNQGIVGDVEPECMSIPQSIGWVQLRRRAGFDPSLYVNETYGWNPCKAAFAQAGVPQPHWWVADYDGIPIIPVGAVAKQYENPSLTHGHFDLSVALDYWPGVDPQGDDMPTILGLAPLAPGTPLYLIFEADQLDPKTSKILRMTVKRHITLEEWNAYYAGGAQAKGTSQGVLDGIPDYQVLSSSSPASVTGTFTGKLS